MLSYFAMSSAQSGQVEEKKELKKPKYTRFTQQELPACKPILTPEIVISTFFIIGVIFIPIGAIAYASSNSVVEIVKRYENICIPAASNGDRDLIVRAQNQTNCTITLEVQKKMKPPIFVYYELDNFYQNHRRYVNSRSDSQLRGSANNGSDLDNCKPEAYLRDNESLPINPCGLIAWSLFNDTYSFSYTNSSTTNSSTIEVDESNIAWKSDRQKKFGDIKPFNFNTDPALRGGATLNESKNLSEDEHLIVWMRTAALPTFRKLWGRINVQLNAGDKITVNIANRYNTYSFNGKKKIVLSTASWLGGKNDFLAVAYLAVGSLCIFLALLFLALHFISPRRLGDTSYLSWNRHG